MATLLAATQLLSRPLARLATKAPHCKDAATRLRALPEVSFSVLTQTGRRTYVTDVDAIGERPVLITGCDSGFGFALAKYLHEKGFIVYAGCLLKDQGRGGAKDLDSMNSDRMRTVQLNVCDSEDVARAVDHVTATLKNPDAGVWGLVNNAGISTFGEVEFTSMDTYKEVAEVNLWGTIRTTKAFLPLIRRAKGRVVNISSMMGRMANPARSPYCITKFGVEAFSDCLRYEMHPHDVKVCIVEPGNFIAGTSLYSPERIKAIADKMWDELPEIVRRNYGRKYFDEQIAKMESYCDSGSTDTSPVIESIGHALMSISPYTRYHPMDYYWWLRMQVMTHMPAAISDRLYIY
ncbi:D-beta-hydroxybutyrate dehydrogenase, mitochondrial [Sphaerodactylus townsendi]|uniref:D-beta-hydroxybutyrate dehydrogenase, mitochondrial n=1 Tax=Sphaerodactylus townsendi TaxID=933632 RepID=UPI0020260AFF|nr:D-beta-hydroxybutyrate dehydrogenase, mitochondrial [Sphaerodactylus townsendi]XP_048361458.1 D-beta-hydroxybutyrate dehydrogenase, mitochondrial [Sphaerodactylus townsendi]